MDMEQLRQKLKTKLEKEDISLRRLAEIINVSFATTSRFLRGGDVSCRVYENLSCWCDGISPRSYKQISSCRLKVGGNIFIVTIEQVLKDGEHPEAEGED